MKLIVKNINLLKNPVFLASIVIAFATLARLPGLMIRPLENNEAISMLVVAGESKPNFPIHPKSLDTTYTQMFSKVPAFSDISAQLKRKDVHPPFYFYALSIWKTFFGENITTLRLFSLCTFSLSAFFFFLILRTGPFGSFSVPLLAFYSFTGSTIFYSYDIRQYILCILFTNIGVYLAIQAKHKKFNERLAWIFGSGLIWGAGFFTQYVMIFGAMATGLYVLILPLNGTENSLKSIWRERFKNVVTFVIPFSIATKLTWPFYLAQRNSRPDQDAGYLGFFSDVASYGNLLRMDVFLLYSNLVLPVLGLTLIAITLIAVLTLFRRLANHHWREIFFAFCVCFFPVAGMMAMNLLLDKHIYRFQTASLCVSGFIWVLSWGLYEIFKWKKSVAIAIVSVFLICQISGMNLGKLAPADYRYAPYRNVVNDMILEVVPQTLVIVDRGQSRDLPAAVLIYLKEEAQLEIRKNIDIVYVDDSPFAGETWDLKRYQKIFLVSEDWNETYFVNPVSATTARNHFKIAASLPFFRILTR